MSQSTSSSNIKTDSKSVSRNHRKAFKCPSHASALPLDIRLSLSARILFTSSSVHFGCDGMMISSSVMLAARTNEFLRGEPSRDTAMTAPNCRTLVPYTATRNEKNVEETWLTPSVEFAANPAPRLRATCSLPRKLLYRPNVTQKSKARRTKRCVRLSIIHRSTCALPSSHNDGDSNCLKLRPDDAVI